MSNKQIAQNSSHLSLACMLLERYWGVLYYNMCWFLFCLVCGSLEKSKLVIAWALHDPEPRFVVKVVTAVDRRPFTRATQGGTASWWAWLPYGVPTYVLRVYVRLATYLKRHSCWQTCRLNGGTKGSCWDAPKRSIVYTQVTSKV